jgi:ATP-dependent Clp protease ATP-binding subunit ClpC
MKEVGQAGNVILFIDEIHTVIGAGGAEGSIDASNMLKPALSRGELQCIGATTLDEYRKYFEKDAALERRFQPVVVEEPSPEQALEILSGIKSRYEEFHRVSYSDQAVEASVELSRRYIAGRFLPDKAIDLLDEAGAYKKVGSPARPPELLQIEEEIRRLNEEKLALVSTQNYEKAAETRDRVRHLKARLEALKSDWEAGGNSAVVMVTEDDLRFVVSESTGIPLGRLAENEAERLLHLEETIHRRVVGQEEAIAAVASSVRRSRAGVSDGRRPLGSFIFLGPTGVGKTLVAKSLAEQLFGSEEALIRIDMSDFMERHNAARLVGAPPGYVGYDEGGMLTEKVRRKPYSVVLFDEIEKAHPEVFNILLQLLEEGELRDNLGHVVSFRNAVVIMTSNAGAREIQAGGLGFRPDERLLSYAEIRSSALSELKRRFNPEFVNRVDDIVVFKPLERAEIKRILDLFLSELASRLAAKGIVLETSQGAREYLAEKGYDPAYGARPMRRLIQSEIEDRLAEEILQGRLAAGQTALVELRGGAIGVRPRKSGLKVPESSGPVTKN